MQFQDLFLTPQHYDDYVFKLDKQLKQFSYSYMNNSKWKKLFIAIFQNTNLIKQCVVVNIFESGINQLRLDTPTVEQDIHQEFMSNSLNTGEYAIYYKGICYIEFLKTYQTNPKPMEQNIQEIKKYLSHFGVFEFEETKNYLRVMGYR